MRPSGSEPMAGATMTDAPKPLDGRQVYLVLFPAVSAAAGCCGASLPDIRRVLEASLNSVDAGEFPNDGVPNHAWVAIFAGLVGGLSMWCEGTDIRDGIKLVIGALEDTLPRVLLAGHKAVRTAGGN